MAETVVRSEMCMVKALGQIINKKRPDTVLKNKSQTACIVLSAADEEGYRVFKNLLAFRFL